MAAARLGVYGSRGKSRLVWTEAYRNLEPVDGTQHCEKFRVSSPPSTHSPSSSFQLISGCDVTIIWGCREALGVFRGGWSSCSPKLDPRKEAWGQGRGKGVGHWEEGRIRPSGRLGVSVAAGVKE